MKMPSYSRYSSAVRALRREQARHPDKDLFIVILRDGTWEVVAMVFTAELERREK